MATRAVSTVVTYRAWDTSANAAKTGDVANHTLKWIKDGTAATPTNSPSEVDATNAPGIYKLTLTSTETDCTFGVLAGKSGTASISLFGVEIGFEYVPTSATTFGAFIGNATAALAVDGSGHTTFANTTIGTVTTLTNLPSIPANWLTATGIAASALNGKGDWLLSSSYSAPPSSTTIAGAVWDVTLSGHLTAGTTGNALNAAGAAGDPWTTAIPGSYGAGTAGNIVGNNLNAAITTRLATAGYTAPDNTDVVSILSDLTAGTSTIYGQVGAIKAKTDNLPASPAAVGSAMTLTTGERTSVADAVLDRDMSTGTDSGSPTVRTVRQALRFLRNKWAIAAGTLTVYKEDDATASWTATVGTDAAANPIVSNDPA
jgi:hypothetical protein